MGRWGFALPATVAAGVVAVLIGLPAPAYAGGTVTVPGTSFPDPTHASLSFVGCQDLYQRGDEQLLPMVGRGPGAAPLGQRSLGFDLAGGDAAGAMFPVESVLLTTTVGLMVHADGPATGVAYVGYQAPADAGTTRLWLGRTELTTPGGAWQRVDVVQRSFVWTEYDMTTHQVIDQGPPIAEPVALFAAMHGGDGPGVFTVGFGCDGTPFSIDALQVGRLGAAPTTYDLEGLTTTVTAGGSDSCTGECTLTATLATNTGDPVPYATLILEQSRGPHGPWQPVQVVALDGDRATATVDPEGRAYYRWEFVDRPLASGSVSGVIQVGIDQPPSPTNDPSPTSSPSTSPTGSPTTPADPTTSTPSPTDAGSPTQSATESPTESPTEPPTVDSSASTPTDTASDPPTQASPTSGDSGQPE